MGLPLSRLLTRDRGQVPQVEGKEGTGGICLSFPEEEAGGGGERSGGGEPRDEGGRRGEGGEGGGGGHRRAIQQSN